MIKSLTVTNPRGESLTLELSNPWSSGLMVQSIEGLGPVKADVNGAELSTMDGSLFNSARQGTRNIILTLKPIPMPTVESTRHLTYQYFPVKKEITLRIETDERTLETTGYVESNEPDIFNKNETTQISILCFDPLFYSVNRIVSRFDNVNPMFEFPFSNDSLTSPTLIFGEILGDVGAVVNYFGDADVGVIMTIYVNSELSDFAIYKHDTNEKMEFSAEKIGRIVGEGILSGDQIVVSTIRGKRYARLIRGGVTTNIIAALNRDADWFQLTYGTNEFTLDISENGSATIDFIHYIAYTGV